MISPEPNTPEPNAPQNPDKDASSLKERLGRDNVFFAAVAMTRMPMLVTDPNLPDNPVVFSNAAFTEMTGYEPHEILGRNCRFLQGPDTDPDAVAMIRSAIAARTDIAVELLNYRKDGSSFWNALFISPVLGADGRLLYYFGSQLDVTRRRDAEAALRRAQRLEALGQLTGGVAHDFNNLLQVVVGSLEMLRPVVEASGDPRALRRHEAALEAARRGAALTRQLLAFARRQRLDGRAVDLNATLAGMHELLAGALGTGIRLRLDLAPELPAVRLDVAQLEAALLNLLVNARDAMPQGGRVTVATRLVPPQDSDATAEEELAGHEGGFVELAVTDTGTGIPPEILDRVTEPFFTTKDVGQGSGLGLAQVYGFVRQSGGHMRIGSEVGRGTTLRLRFPALEGAADAEKPLPPRRRAEPPGGGESVLIVDDNPEVLELAESVLTDLGYQVSTAPDARTALALLEEPGWRVDLLFTDVVMPGRMNGITLATEARRRRPGLKVLLSTGYVDPRQEEAAGRAGGGRRHGFPVIEKPYRRGELARRVRAALDAGPAQG